MNKNHWDTLTSQECHLVSINEIDLDWCWIKFHDNGRPRTRRKAEVITLAERERRKAERERQAQQSAAQQLPYWQQTAHLDKMIHVCEVQQATLKWLHEHAVKYRKDYNSTWPPPILSIVTQDMEPTPQWVLDCLATVNG